MTARQRETLMRGAARRPLRAITAIAAIAALALAAALAGAVACGSSDDRLVTLTIRRGSTFREAAESLAVHDVVRNARLFGFYATLRERDRKMRYGTYLIRRGASWNEILAALELGRGIVNRVTIPEGWPIWEVVPLLAERLGLSADSLEAAVRDTVLLRRAGVPRNQETLEGYLFPDTYDVPAGTTARQAIDLLVGHFERMWKPEWSPRLAEIKMTRHEVVTLASIIEKEVSRREEQPLVAAVYLNRLRIRMPLQADPTIQYAQRRRPGRVLYRDLRVDSPYNTYRRAGLPPGPIASPGGGSLEAALYPVKVSYRFFVAHPDGHHEFRTTYREHLVAIQMVRTAARRDSLARLDQARVRALDSALKAVGVPRATFDSIGAKRP